MGIDFLSVVKSSYTLYSLKGRDDIWFSDLNGWSGAAHSSYFMADSNRAGILEVSG